MASSDYCNNCKFYLGDLRCLAFNVIPDEIVTGQLRHDRLIEGQEGEFIFMDKEKNIEEFLLVK